MQNERGPGAGAHKPFISPSSRPGDVGAKVDSAAWKSKANPNPPNVAEGKNHYAKGVPMAPKINEGTDGQPDGAKRVINTEVKARGRDSTRSTYTAPRKGDSHDPMECGYTRPGKM